MSTHYVVSARKYRPQTFDTVVGQGHITTTLKNAIKNKQLAHAYLFCGPRGVGKTTCARILARTINCEQPTADMEACGTCNTCQSFNNNASFNIFELDAASNNSVDDIRELVNQVRFAPQQGTYKIYIIDEVHMLSTAAFNAFLKTLEEPPAYAIFILATTEKHKILPTILSRCQIFDFRRITSGDIVGHLEKIAQTESIQSDENALHLIAQKSEGCMRDALSLFDKVTSFGNGKLEYNVAVEQLNLLDTEFYFRLSDLIQFKDTSGVLLAINKIIDRGFEGIHILEGFQEHLRNILLCKDQELTKILDVPGSLRKQYFEKALITPTSFILSALSVLNDAEVNYRNMSNKRLHTELAFLKLTYLDAFIESPSAFEKSPSALPVEEEEKKKLVRVVEDAPKPYTATPSSTIPTQTPNIPSEKEVTPPTKAVNSDATLPVAPPANSNNLGVPLVSLANLQNAKNAQANNGKRVIKKANIDDLIDLEALAQQTTKQHIELKAADIQDVLNAFKQDMAADGSKSFILSYFDQISIQIDVQDSVRLICHNEMQESFIKRFYEALRLKLVDHYQRQIKLILEVQETEEPTNHQVKVLSKQEILLEMAVKQPLIKELYDALKLNIDY